MVQIYKEDLLMENIFINLYLYHVPINIIIYNHIHIKFILLLIITINSIYLNLNIPLQSFVISFSSYSDIQICGLNLIG
jgi:hypothetical protein